MSDSPNHQKTTPPARQAPSGWFFNAPAYLLTAMLMIHLLDQHLPVALVFFMPWKMLGWLPILVGCGFCAAGAERFRRQATTLNPHGVSQSLVVGGVFRFTRNPMYLGMVWVLIGICFIAGSVAVWVVPPLFVLAVGQTLIRHEEERLAEQFGEAYAQYRQQVRRWV